MVNIVTLADGKKYMVDVGFGINAPTQPHLLESGVIRPGVESQEMRLLWDTIVPTTDPNQHLWILQWRDIGSEQWLTNYCFTETEFLPADYEIINYYTYHSPKSWFTQVAVLAKFTQLEYQGPLVGSLVMLNGEVKQRIGATDRGIIESCSNESERIAALKNYFDIDLSEKEKQGIRGTKCELKA